MGNEASSSKSTGESIENNISVEWKKTVNENPFPCREGQCCCACGNKLFVFGGVLQSNSDELLESNELLSFDIDTQTWQKVACKNKAPPARSAASLVSVGDKLYLFGGLNQTCGWLDDLYEFDTVNLAWTKLKTEGKNPSPRDKLQGVAVDTNIYYFGGFGPKSVGETMEDDDDEEYEDQEDLPEDQEGAEFGWFNDLFVLDTVSKKWSQPMQLNLGVPTQRAAHGMCAVDKQIVIFGGRDTEARQNDLHIFNTETRKWEMDMSIKGRQPPARSFHTATAVGDRVVVMGGRGTDNNHFADLHVFDINTKEWLQPKVSGDLPNGRGQHSVAVVKDSLVLYGGSSKFSAEIMQCQKFHRDTYLLKTDSLLQGGAIKQNGHSEEGS